MILIAASNRKELNKKLDREVYCSFEVIKKVEGGYMCFETVDEYETWQNQK